MSDTTVDPNESTEQQQSPAGSTEPQAGTGGTTEQSKSTSFDGEFDPDRAKKLIENLRADLSSAKAKTQTKEQEHQGVLDAVSKALGLKKDEVDPEKLTAELSARDERIRELETRDAVRVAAAKHQADAAGLLDSNSFLKALADLDPTAKDFPERVADAVEAAVKAKPSLKTGAKAPRSGADFSGAGTGSTTNRPKGLSDAVNRHYTKSS